MTYDDLSQLRWINKEIVFYQHQIQYMEKSNKETSEMQGLLDIAKQRWWINKNSIEMWIDEMTDERLRMISRMKFVNGYTWLEIASKIGEAEETVLQKEVEDYINKEGRLRR